MAYTTYYWRNYNSSDTTRLTYTGDYVISVEDAGWEAPSGYVFSKWNSKRDGSGTSYSVGDASPQPWVVGDLYAIYSEIQVPEIDITYKGSSIATLSTNGTLTLETEGMYCEDDITVSYTRKNGSATTPETSYHPTINISVNQNGLVSANVDATEIITPTVVEGYVSSGTAGNIYINSNNNYQLTVQAAQTIHPSTSDQTIASGKYLTGTQTVKGVLLTNLSADNIKKDVVVKVGDSTDDDCVTSVTGTYEGGGGGDDLKNFIEQHGTMTSFTNDAVSAVGVGAFAYCINLTTASFSSCTSIGSSAFVYCAKLTTVSFPVCTSIGDSAFANCSKLTTVSFPACTDINGSAFAFCSSLTTVSFPACTSIGASAFYSCRGLTTVSFPVCTSIGYRAFQGCANLSTINFPTCKIIGTFAFYDCFSLTTAIFPVCTNIGSNAFAYCSNLTTASFPSCTSIGSSAFIRCYSLISVYLTGSSIAQLANSNAFSSTPIAGYTTSTGGVYGSIFVPSSLYATYIASTNWTYFSSRFVSV